MTFNIIDIGTAFLSGVCVTLAVIVVYYGGGDPPHPRG
jgi:hypothetical protein